MPDLTSLLAALEKSADLSDHPSEKIAAQILYEDGSCDGARVNAQPPFVQERNLPKDTKIAGRSLFVHAETRGLLHASRPTRGAALLVTDPVCPNCAKQIALAGIKSVFIAAKGFSKPYFVKNSAAFDRFSLAILGHYYVDVYRCEAGAITRLPCSDLIAAIEAKTGGGQTIIAREGADLFTEKYDAHIESITESMMTACANGTLPRLPSPLSIKDYPQGPRPFIDALDIGHRHYKLAPPTTKPPWAEALGMMGVGIEHHK